MKYIIDEEDIRKIAEDLLPALSIENNIYNKIEKDISEYLTFSFVEDAYVVLARGYRERVFNVIEKIIKEKSKMCPDSRFDDLWKVKNLVKEKKWNELDVMFGFDSPTDHDKNREDMKCRF